MLVLDKSLTAPYPDARGWWISPPRSAREKLPPPSDDDDPALVLALLPVAVVTLPAIAVADTPPLVAIAFALFAPGDAFKCRNDGELLRWKPPPVSPAAAVGVRPPIGPKLPGGSML